MQPKDTQYYVQPRRSGVLLPLVIGCGAFFVGIGATVGYGQWQAQQAKIAEMSQLLQEMQQGGVVSRAEQVDLLSPAPVLSQPVVQQVEQVAVAPEVVAPDPAPVPAVVAPAAPTPKVEAAAVEEDEKTTAERIEALMSRADDPLVSAALAQDEARRETMSVAIQGVNELAAAAVAGNYVLTTETEDEKEVLRIWFPQKLIDQVQLETLLSSAAEAGMIAVSDAVKTSDGVYDGRVILFDLVERALTNGSPIERAVGAKIEEEAVAILAKINPAAAQVTEVENGQRYYTVEAGDSLAYIALQFYGNTNNYLTIFQANRDKLSSPERIQIGQRLVIPQT
ncbi:LysM peptidoglycan-binding domain-containing protein [uncultured Tateyamaria sp.]|uniref:LysM peptidoglycan-binding domain-containing protein n=1 Tax=uncultured Tateyamaria sp. TaxID=455651 RepID=UPI00263114CF|nr:LysM peptidoglycan-binding domain-containing protein [uncultured Tateyamaria sp.]